MEMTRQEIGEIERPWLFLVQDVERLEARIKGVTMSAGQAFDRFLGEDAIELAAGAAIAVGAEYRRAERSQAMDLSPDGLGDQLRPVMQLRRQAGELDADETILLHDGANLPREGAARDDDEPDPLVAACAGMDGEAASVHANPRAWTEPWRPARSDFAVSTAIEASRQ